MLSIRAPINIRFGFLFFFLLFCSICLPFPIPCAMYSIGTIKYIFPVCVEVAQIFILQIDVVAFSWQYFLFRLFNRIHHTQPHAHRSTCSRLEYRFAFDCKCNSSRWQVLLVELVAWNELSSSCTEKSHTQQIFRIFIATVTTIIYTLWFVGCSIWFLFIFARQVSSWWQITIICFLHTSILSVHRSYHH